MGAEQNAKPMCFTSDSGMKKAKIVQIGAEKERSPISRVFKEKAVPQSLPVPSTDKLLQKYNKYESKSVKTECAQKEKARRIAAKVLLKKRTALAVLQSLHNEGIAPAPIVSLLSKIAAALVPGKVVTSKDLQDIAGTKPDGVSVKWWNEGFPILIDVAGLTIKTTKSERRFAELCDLERRCFVLTNLCEKMGGAVVNQFDRLGGALVSSDPFTERAKDGSLIVHERPSQTSEGKEAGRRVAQAQYLKKMNELEASAQIIESGDYSGSHNGYIELLKEYKVAVGGVIVVVLLLVAAAAENVNKTEINPALEQSSLSIDAIAEQDSDYGYLADE